MGQIAEDIINGASCSLCGIYFIEDHGYPVVCNDCWGNSTKKNKEISGLQKATIGEI